MTRANKRVITGSYADTVDVNVWENKEIVFTGSQTAAARFVGMTNSGSLSYYLRTKALYKKKYAIRYVKN